MTRDFGCVTEQQATVYYGRGRRWFTLRAACRAEAWATVVRDWELDGEELRSDEARAEVERRAKQYAKNFKAARKAPALEKP